MLFRVPTLESCHSEVTAKRGTRNLLFTLDSKSRFLTAKAVRNDITYLLGVRMSRLHEIAPGFVPYNPRGIPNH